MRVIKDIEPKVKVNISPGKASERQRRLWRSWWRLMITSVREEMGNEEKREHA